VCSKLLGFNETFEPAGIRVGAMKIALLTAGGLAPCLSASVGGLIAAYTKLDPTAEIIGYRDGYAGLLKGDSVVIDVAARAGALQLLRHGGSPLGNSRVKLTNQKDCVKRGLVPEGADPLHVAAEQLTRDGVNVLHTIGGDDTNTTAADLAAYLATNNYALTVVGLPKTIDNDVYPIAQSLGAHTAAEEGAIFFEHIVYEGSANPRSLIVHEVMGRNCGWLTAETARVYRSRLLARAEAPLAYGHAFFDLDAVYIPESPVDIAAEAKRLRAVMDTKGSVNVFVSEGAAVADIVAEIVASGGEVERDAFGHVKLDKVNVGAWFAKKFADLIGAEKAQVQKSGYYARASAANEADLALIATMVDMAAQSALAGISGVIGHDDDHNNELRAIEFPRIKGGKPFDATTPWFVEMLKAIGQTA
jgi:diphosphate-dependent phosphofructokinase